MQARETFLMETILFYKRAIHIESEHRWYYDVYTNAKEPASVDDHRAFWYKFNADDLPNWRAILHEAKALKLDVPDTIQLKRYSVV